MVRHSCWIACTFSVASSHCLLDFSLLISNALICSINACFFSKFSFSLACNSSKYAWCFLLMMLLACLKRFHKSSRNSRATGPISAHSSCNCCNARLASTMLGFSCNFSAASHSRVFISRFFLKSKSRNSILIFTRS